MDFTKLTELNIGGHQLVSLKRASDGKVLWEKRNEEKLIRFLASNNEWQEFSYREIKKYQGNNHTLNYRSSSSPYTVQNPFQINSYLSSSVTEGNNISNVYEIDILDNMIEKIGSHAFYYCSNLSSIDIPNVTSIQSAAFYRCSNLSSINCPNVSSIGVYAFLYCSNLSSINCPNVTSIENSTFSNCSKLSSIDFSLRTLTTIPTLENTNTFSGLPSNYQIKVPSALYSSWIATTNWSSIKSHIVAV